LIHAETTTITQTMNQPSKRDKNRRNENFWKIKMQRQISNRWTEIPILAVIGTGCDNGKLKRKRERFLKKIWGDKCQRSSAADRDTEVEIASKKSNESEDKKKGKPSINKIRCSKKTKTFYRN
jgi:hypothetical protein